MKHKKGIIVSIIILLVCIIIGKFYSDYSKKYAKVVFLSYSGIVFGEDSAPIKIYLFTSFSCSKCKELNAQLSDTIKSKIKNNEVQLIYKVTDDYAFNWSNEMLYNYDFITSSYETWSKYANENALDTLSSDEIEKREEMKKEINSEMERYNISVMPVFYINGDKYSGIYTKDEFETILSKY
jgi:protein-disulfide isomerase